MQSKIEREDCLSENSSNMSTYFAGKKIITFVRLSNGAQDRVERQKKVSLL